MTKPFRFKQFEIHQHQCAMKVSTDGVLLGAWSDVALSCRALDIGTGTGVIAMMLAQRNPNLYVDAIEIDKSAYLQASANISNSIFASRIQVYHGDVQQFGSTPLQQYDLIISNPPYFNTGKPAENPLKANVRHTLQLSHDSLLASVYKLLKEEGYFDVILPYTEGLHFLKNAVQYGFFPMQIMEVYPRAHKPVERLLIRFGRSKGEVQKNQLIIHDMDNPDDYSEDFVALTKEFYLFM